MLSLASSVVEVGQHCTGCCEVGGVNLRKAIAERGQCWSWCRTAVAVMSTPLSLLPASQGFTPPFPAPALAAMLSYIEGDVFRGSRRMPLHDALQVITDKTLETVPGLLRGHIATLRVALRNAKQAPPLPLVTAMSSPSTGTTVTTVTTAAREVPVSTDARRAVDPPPLPLVGLTTVRFHGFICPG